MEDKLIKQFKTTSLKLEAETISEQLRSARQQAGISLAEISERLQINLKYLEALEKGNLNLLPQGAYGRNFLREYAIFLKLNYVNLIRDFEKERKILNCETRKEDYFSKPIIRKTISFSALRLARNLLIASAIIVCFIYLGIAVRQIFAPPLLEIITPTQDLIVISNSIEVSGHAEEEAQVSINDEIIATTEGFFTKTVSLKKGINTINIVALKKYGSKKIIQRQILLK